MYGKAKEIYAASLAEVRSAGLEKKERLITTPQGAEIRVQGGEKLVLNFCANNYLGLANHPAVLQAALIESGFDAGRFGELVQDPGVKARLLDNTQRSVARGTFGSPAFFVGDEIFFGKDRLRDVEEAILATR